MKVAVFGYYHALNAGDDRIQYCINRLLREHTVVFLPHYLPPPIDYIRKFDWILIGGGGLVFERVGIWVNMQRWLKLCQAKIGVIGLGINRLTPDLFEEVKALIDKSEFFYVRDQTSKELLNNDPKVDVFPDITWCYPLRQLEVECQSGIALNLLPCHWKEFSPEKWVEALQDRRILPFPFHFGKARDAELLKEFYGSNVPDEFTLSPLYHSELLVGCRFHALIFALQLRKPFIAINYDEKVHRLLEESGLTDLCLETTDHHLIHGTVSRASLKRDEYIRKLDIFARHQEELAKVLKENIKNHLSCEERREEKSFFNKHFKFIP